MNNRINDVVLDIVQAVRGVLEDRKVTFEEYRAATDFLQQLSSAAPYEIPLMMDLWFNATIHDIEMETRKGSLTNLEGPYFLGDIPDITDEIPSRDNKGEKLLLTGKVTDLNGAPAVGAEVYIWHSDNDGMYSGFAEGFSTDFCRGKLTLGDDGTYGVTTRMPAPYTIPSDGPTGELLKLMGRHPWRPAHIHWKIRHPNLLEHTTQTYFRNTDWVDNDCVDGVRDDLIFDLEKDGDVLVLRKDFVLDPA